MKDLDRMISWLAALGAVVLAAALTLASPAQGASGDVRIEVLSVTPRPPRATQHFEIVAASGVRPGSGVDTLQRLDRQRAIQKHSPGMGELDSALLLPRAGWVRAVSA